MHDEIQSELKKIEKLAQAEKHEEALARTDALVASHGQEPDIWSVRGYVNGRHGDLLAAISDLSKYIELRGNEPNDFFA